MKSYHIVAISVGAVMIVFSLLTLFSFLYCIYVMCQEKITASPNEVRTETAKMDKNSGNSSQPTRTISAQDNPTTDPSMV